MNFYILFLLFYFCYCIIHAKGKLLGELYLQCTCIKYIYISKERTFVYSQLSENLVLAISVAASFILDTQ